MGLPVEGTPLDEGPLGFQDRASGESDPTLGVWEEIPFLDHRDSIAWTVDPRNGDIYLFGGYTYSDYHTWGPGSRRDLWRYNASADEWTRLHDGTPGPSARSLASLAFDPDNERLYLVGGTSGVLTDTDKWVRNKDLWVFDLATVKWTRKVNDLGDYIGAIGYSNGMLYGITGKDSHSTDIRLMSFDLDTNVKLWYDVSDSTYPLRRDFASTYDPENNRFYIFGGWNYGGRGFVVYGDLWVVDATHETMSQLTEFPEGVRKYTDIAYNTDLNAFYMYGGSETHVNYNAYDHDDLWLYFAGNDTWWKVQDTSRPGEMVKHALLHDPVNDLLYLNCPPHAQPDACIWKYNISSGTWDRFYQAISPSNVRHLSMEYLEGSICTFGGYDIERLRHGSKLHIFNTSTETLTQPSFYGPRGRYLQSTALDREGDRFFIFNGFYHYRNELVNSLWSFTNRAGWSRLDWGSECPPFANCSMAYSEVDDSLYIYGGENLTSSEKLDQLWRVNLANMTWTLVAEGGPNPRVHSTMIYNRHAESIYVFGGLSYGLACNDIWRFDIFDGRWSLVEPTGSRPVGRYHHAIEYDPHSDSMIVSGGVTTSGSTLSDLWFFSFFTKSWIKVGSDNNPPPRFGHSLALDTDMDLLYLFGGAAGDISLWRIGLRRGPVRITPRPYTVHATEDVPFSMAFNTTNWTTPFWNFETNASWLKWNGGLHELSGVPDNSHVGRFWVRLGVTTNFGEEDHLNFTVIVENTPPEVLATGPCEAHEDVPWFMELTSTDDGQGVITWRLEAGPPAWVTLGPTTGTLSGTPSGDDVGRHYVHVSVDDGNGGRASATIIVDVLNTNDSPKIVTKNVGEAYRDELYFVQYIATDEDPTQDGLTWRFETNASFLNINSHDGLLFGTPSKEDIGTYQVRLWVDDGNGGNDTTWFILRVVDRPPEIIAIGSYLTNRPIIVHVPEDEEMDLQVMVKDEDEYSIGYSIESDLESLELDPWGMIHIPAVIGRTGQYIVTITVTDDMGQTDKVTFIIAGEDVNFPPYVMSNIPSIIYANEDEPFQLSIEVEDPDGNSLEWSDDCSLFDVDPWTGNISFIPLQEDVGPHKVSLTVDDRHGGIATIVLNIMVVNVNDPPLITVVHPLNGSIFRLGEAIDFGCNASDEDGDDINCTWMLGDQVLADGFDFTTTELPEGTHEISITVNDGDLRTTASVVIVVETLDPDPTDPGSAYLLLVLVSLVAIALAYLALRLRAGQRPPSE